MANQCYPIGSYGVAGIYYYYQFDLCLTHSYRTAYVFHRRHPIRPIIDRQLSAQLYPRCGLSRNESQYQRELVCFR